MAKQLPQSFYGRHDVLQLARELLGTRLVTCFNKQRTAGLIVETEAYAGPADRASHAYGGRRTARTETMFAAGGCAYVYLCYGIYHLFNVVVGPKEVPHAVLVRGLEPVEGISYMLARCKQSTCAPTLTNGPGKLTRALGIDKTHDAMRLSKGSPIWIEERSGPVADSEIIASPRIGVDYAGDDALLPYRFTLKDNPYVSR